MKEKINRKMVFVVQESLCDEFKEACEKEYKTMSEVIRNSMLHFIKEHKNGKKIND